MEQSKGLYGIKAERIGYYPFHLNPNLRLLYVLEGSIKLRFVCGEHLLEAGEIEILNIDEPVQLQGAETENLVLIFEFNKSRVKAYSDFIDRGIFNCNSTLFYSSVTSPKDQETLKRKMRLLYRYYLGSFNELAAEKTVEEIVLFICDQCHDMKNMFRNTVGDDAREERFLRIYTYILENCEKKINLKSLADGEYLSPQYLSKEFNDKLKINFKETLEYFRIIQSVRYLIKSRMTVTQISEQCGFSAPRYFYKHFAGYMNCTPVEFKEKYLSRKEEARAFPVNHSHVAAMIQALDEGGERAESCGRSNLTEPDAPNWKGQLENAEIRRLLKLLPQKENGEMQQAPVFQKTAVPKDTLDEMKAVLWAAKERGGFAGSERSYHVIQDRQVQARLAELLKVDGGEVSGWSFPQCSDVLAAPAVFLLVGVKGSGEDKTTEAEEEAAAVSVGFSAALLCVAAGVRGLRSLWSVCPSQKADVVAEAVGLPLQRNSMVMVGVGFPVKEETQDS